MGDSAKCWVWRTEEGRPRTAPAAEFSGVEKMACLFGKEIEGGVGIGADSGRQFGGGGGQELEVAVVELDLGHAQAIGSEIDADRIRGRREDALDKTEHALAD